MSVEIYLGATVSPFDSVGGSSAIDIRISSVCDTYVLACYLHITRMYSYVIRMSLVCTHMSSVCHSYVLVCHSCVTRMYLYLFVCHPYVTLKYSHVIRISLVFGFTINNF